MCGCMLVYFSVEKYLQDIQAQCIQTAVGVHAIPTGAHIRDDEQVRWLINPLPNNKILDWSKLKQIADDILTLSQTTNFRLPN